MGGCPAPNQGVDSPVSPIFLPHSHLWRIWLKSMPWYGRQRGCEKLPIRPRGPLTVTGPSYGHNLCLSFLTGTIRCPAHKHTGSAWLRETPVASHCVPGTPQKDSGALHRGPIPGSLPWLCVQRLLASSRLDPSASLDFLWACIHVPRIWQGRDQRTPQAGLKLSQPCGWWRHVLGLTCGHLIAEAAGGAGAPCPGPRAAQPGGTDPV